MTNKLCKLALVMALMVVTLGALTRLLDAGLGCPDWPGCYGQLTPPNSEQYSGTAVVDQGKAWMEMTHRYIAGALGLLILIIAVRIEINKTLPANIRWLSRALFLLVVVQGLFGMLTVTMQLLPQIVTLHLLGGMTVLALLFLLMLQLQSAKSVSTAKNLKTLALTVLILLSCQIALGGWTSSNYAGLACPDFPTCQNQWLPEMALTEAFNITEISDLNYEGGLLTAQARVTIQVVHRLFAFVLFVSILALFLRLWQLPQIRFPAALLLGLTLLQLSLGIANAVLLLPLPLALAHNTGAALLLLSMVYINYVSFAKMNTSGH
ncbi:COX15/CtaA family protein [Methylophaga sp. OBS4]|uniref:COX15/CtaA family protein n=1 Tax=Methylophaga sp. OBS4 TaxID=2991935 RepID=UPI00224FD2F5|nr:COX15/CtaA family protein [Methylophaga sp. OBS4]MCX4187215.1 COX15/CtaA family protein [Methylophaga sp. OBS4]